MVEFIGEKKVFNDIKLTRIKEGSTEIFVPDPEFYVHGSSAYLPTSLPVFYNPVMEINRDLSIIFTKLYLDVSSEDKIYYVESMAGTGIRGFRILNEIDDDRLIVIMNDISRKAYELIKYNSRVLGYDSDRLILFNLDANYLFRKLCGELHIRPNIIDIDPYGTPAPFIFNALNCMKSNMGMLLITATDTAPLVGKFPNAALRKYGSKIIKNPFSREVAVRALTYMIGREGTILSIKIRPIIGLFLHHFIRLVLITDRGRRKSDEFWRSIGWMSFCPICSKYYVAKGLTNFPPSSCEIKGHGNTYAIGPIWVDPIIDPEYLIKAINVLRSNRSISPKNKEKLLSIFTAELETGDILFYYSIQEIARRLKVSTPAISDIVNYLRELGFRASRTHFDSVAIKTDAPLEILIKAVRELSPLHALRP